MSRVNDLVVSGYTFIEVKNMEFKDSQTKENLMRAFAGESQARNRYTFAADIAKKQGQYMISEVFKFTADQEKAHAEVFYNHLRELLGQTVFIDGGYPVDVYDDLITLLKSAHHNEYEEWNDVYQNFADIAEKEGFMKVAADFRNIAKVEKMHGDRFKNLAQGLEDNTIYQAGQSIRWVCLNCGFIFEGANVPEKCPVCNYDQGYYIRLGWAPYTSDNL